MLGITIEKLQEIVSELSMTSLVGKSIEAGRILEAVMAHAKANAAPMLFDIDKE